jgi:hypothetical protein
MLAADLASPGLGVDELYPISSPGELVLPGNIAGSVFVADGAAAGEAPQGIAGAKLELLDAAGRVLAEAITDELGNYEFPALDPGTYAIRQLQPAGFGDGHAAVGDGGGRVDASNLISEILVRPGDMLGGYDFVETAMAFDAATAVDNGSVAFPFVPPLIVAWSRPSALAERAREAALPATLPALPPVQMRNAEPFIGGSSGARDEAFASEEADWSRQAQADDEDGVDDAVVAKVARRRAARDIAFAIDSQPGREEAPGEPAASDDPDSDAEPPAPVAQIAARPAA